MIKFEPREEWTLINALRTASEEYYHREHAIVDNPRLREQFKRQSQEALALAIRIETEGLFD